jgi:hypothetical protein
MTLLRCLLAGLIDQCCFQQHKEACKGNPVRNGNCPATVKGTKATGKIKVKVEIEKLAMQFFSSHP